MSVRKGKYHNTIKNFIITLFKAPEVRFQAIWSGRIAKHRTFVALLLITSVGLLQIVQAAFSDDAFVIKTVKVFPTEVTATGWLNVDTISFQNLDDYALYQEFNKINSASLSEGPALNVTEDVQTDTTDPNETLDVNVEGAETSDVDDNAIDTVDNTTVENVPETAVDQIEVESVPKVEEIIEQVEPTEDPVEVEPEADTVDAENTTVLKRADSLFALAVATVDETFNSTTSVNETEATEVQEEVIDELEVVEDEPILNPILFIDPLAILTAKPAVEKATDTDDEVVAEETEEVPEATAEESFSDETVVDEAPEELVEDLPEIVDEEAASSTPIEEEQCLENCSTHTITLGDFGFPLSEGTEISGAQLRLSLAALKKETREHIPELTIRYSTDGGVVWGEAGSIIISDEVSNGINGGYFLFALPEIQDQAMLDNLKIELVYEDDPAVLKELFIDSIWLELFTMEPPKDEAPTSFLDLMADDGYDEGILSGDELVLPTGETVEIPFTDNNKNETLIIKTDQEEYHGVSEITTYFSVTNTGDSEDDFSVQTYFPQGVGNVSSLEVFNQNKPRTAVIPEYRPYVYHCADGWEYVGEYEPTSLEELSKQFAAPSEVPVGTEATTSSEETVPATDVEEAEQAPSGEETPALPVEPEVEIFDNATNTTTVSQRLPGLSQLLQLTTTQELSTEAVVTPVEEEAVAEVAQEDSVSALSEPINTDDEVEVVPSYMCRNTNIIRQCDELDGENTSCRVEEVKVADHEVTQYAPGWDTVETESGAMPKPGLLRRIAEFIGFGPDRKDVPEEFEARIHTPGAYHIKPGETLYFKMDIEFPPFTNGEYWIEAVGENEYGLLDPFWSSNWTYRMPIQVSNNTGQDQSEYQVFFELDSALTDFWSNVNSDGSDVRFIQELPNSNFSNEDTAVVNWLDFDFGHRVPIEIPANTVSADMNNFPVTVDLSSLDSTFWSNVQSDGGDIRVFNSAGTELPIDVAEINTTTQTGDLHFLADVISANGANTFYIYYDDPSLSGYAASDPLGSQAVWVGYNAVYHFNEDADTVGDVITDVTGNGRDVTVTTAALATTTGQFGTAIDFTAGAGYLRNAAWLFQAGNPLYTTGAYKMSAFSNEAVWQWGTANQPNYIEYRPWYSATDGLHYFGVTAAANYPTRSTDTANWHGFSTIGTPTSGQNNYVYEDGYLVETVQQTVNNPSNTNAAAFQIGRSGGGGTWAGYLDELRLATSSRTQAWAEAESLNLSSPTKFYEPRQSQTPNNAASLSWYSTSWDGRQRITIPAAALDSDLTDFPVYLDLSTLGDDFFNRVASDGRDIRVTVGDGVTEVPIELVNINTGSKTGQLYFKADLSDSQINDFYIYFDNSDAIAYDRDDTYGMENVWTNGFQAVYHLEESQSGTGNIGIYKDSTSHRYHGDDENTSNGKYGLFGSGQEFGDSQVDYLDLPYQVMDGLTDNTVSWWHISSTTGDQTIVSGANATQFNEFWERLDNNNTIVVYSQGAGETFTLDNPTTYNDNTWQHFMTTSQDDIDEMNLYVNGVGDTENPDPQAIVELDLDPGGLIIGQDQDALGGNFSNAENFEGFLDELRFASVVRTKEWAAAEYANMANQSSFISTSSAETLSATRFVELDFWLQHFDSTNDVADIWVQVDDLPAEGAVIYMYYGNGSASSASDEYETFTYSTSTDLYYVVDNSGVTQLKVESLIDNNEVSLNGGAPVTLNRGESTTFGTVTNTSVISALGPLSGTLTGPSTDSSDTMAPISFATTTFAVPLNRSTDRWYLYAPFASTTARTYIGNSGTASQTFNINQYAGATATTDPADSGTGTDGSGVVVVASSPVLLTHRSTNPGDGIVAYPPTTRDLFGVDSQYIQLSATADNPDATVYCSSGTGGATSGTTRGEKDDITQCTTGTEGSGSAVRFAAPAQPIAAVQMADGDGNEATTFWPQHEFGTHYAMTNSTGYVAVVCSPRFGTVSLEVWDSNGASISSGTCTPSGNNPGKAYFNNGNGTDGDAVNYSAGHQIVSTNGIPFYAIYEDVSVEQDEKNMLGTVQARKIGGEFIPYVFGPQELANTIDYDQVSFWWYQNGNVLTPTTTWAIGTVGVTEGEAITGAGAVDDGDVLRLRMNVSPNNATGTAGTTAFTLQYGAGATGQCSAVSSWYDLGEEGSTTAAFSGYNNGSVEDGTTLTSAKLSGTNLLGTYEERNYSDFLPVEVPPGDVIEYDWVIEATNVDINTTYCFRMVHAEGREFETYTLYPELETVGPPNVPNLYVYFDNERTTSLVPVLEFAASDLAGDDIHYQVQVDDDYDFASVVIDKNSLTNFTQFENINLPSDKSPFISGNRIRFNGVTGLSATTTYWWRVRASDPNGSATSSAWSTPHSFTTDTVITVSEWYQTTGHQFGTNSLSNLATSSGQVAVTSSPGSMTSTPIDFDDATVGNAWGEVDWNDTETSGTILIQVEYNNNGSWDLVPDDAIHGNSVGTTTAPINILELDTSTYNEIRLVATFTGATLSLQDWSVRWGLRVETPVQGDPFDNQKISSTVPVFDFVSNDPQGDDLEYEISFCQDYSFLTSTTTFNSATAPGFASQLYTSGATVLYTTQPGDAFTDGQTYWWRTRARDPLGGNAWSAWSEPDAFTVDTGVTLSTWFQTTQDQFTQGEMIGAYASTSDSVLVSDIVGEYGTATLTNNNWLTINTQRDYTDMVVVASAEFNGNAFGNSRTPRVRNKTANSFEIKVDNYTDAYSGSTVVDYIVMEAGEWTIADGGTGARIIAGTKADVSDVQIDTYGNSVGQTVSFSPSFSSAPIALLTVSSNNDSNWVATHVDGGGARDTEVTTSQMRVALAVSRHTSSAHSGPEDIDYMVMAPVTNGTNNSVAFKSFNSADRVDDVPTNGGYSQAFPGTAFSGAPAVTVVHNNAEDGGNGAFAQKDTSGAQTGGAIFMSTLEQGATADQHTQEIVSVLAFNSSSGVIKRLNSGTLSGTIAGEDIIFSDGAGPKFETFSWNDTTPATSDVVYQIQYQVSEGVYALVPNSQIPGNSTGTSTSPIDLTGVDINTYPVIRAFATLTCGGGSCPTINDWKLEWSEGVNMSGTLKEYDRLTSVATGTVKAAVNGSPVAGSGTVSGGVWTITNVTAFAGDIVTVWVDGAAEDEEAVAAFVYDGAGDITGVELFEQHLSISADENATTTNALLALNDSTALGDEDVFYQVDASNNLVVCGVGTCTEANLYVGTENVYIPAAAGGVSVGAHDFVNYGRVELDANTYNFSGSWQNNATTTADTSTVNLIATTGTESISSTESPMAFHNLSLGSGVGTTTFTIDDNLDLSNDLSVVSGTLSRDGYSINLAGSLLTGATGFWSGTATTTFDGGSGKTWTDNNPVTQNVGSVVVDGSSAFVTVMSNVAAYDVTIGINDTLAGGTGNTIYVGGDWTNNGTFTANTSTVEIVNDNRTYPPPIPGSADWYSDTDFESRLAIVVDDTKVAGDLTDFPIYVNLSLLGADFWNDVASDGRDIRVTAGDGQTELPIDVVEIDTAAETGELHFLADSLNGSATTTFYIYYNNPSASAYAVTDTYGRNAVWAEYEAVYHFKDDPTAVSNTITDATGNGYTLYVETAGQATTTGQLGSAILLNGTGRLRASNFTWTSGNPLTSSGWYRMTAADDESLWEFGTANQPNYMYFEPWDNGTTRGQYYFGNTTGTTYDFSPRDTLNWNHFFTLGATSTSASNYVYHDDILRETQSQTVANPSNTNATGLQIGQTGTAGFLDAEVDELRFAAVLRSTNWMTTEYNNQIAPQFFYATTAAQTYQPETIIDEATHNINAGGSAFYNFTLNDATTSAAFIDTALTTNNNFTVATGTITLPTIRLTVGGSFINNGYFQHNNAEVRFTSNGASTITLNGTEFYNGFYNVVFAGNGTFTFTDANATTSNDMSITKGTVVFPSGVLTIGGTLSVTGTGAFNANGGTVYFISPDNENITTRGYSFNNVIFGDASPANRWYDAAWGERVVVTIASSSVYATLNDFPVYVNLADLGPEFWSLVHENGDDIRVTASDGYTELPVDLVEFNSGTETGELHFLAPQLSAVTDTRFYLYYDNADATAPESDSTYGSEAVWTGYEAVYHFNSDPATGAIDETGNGKDLAPQVGTPTSIAGVMGSALDLTGGNFMMGDSDWTWTAGDDLVSSGWYYQSAVDDGALWQWGDGTGGSGVSWLSFMPWYTGTTGYHRVGIATGDTYSFSRNGAIWHHFTTNAAATAGEVNQVYEDAALRASVNQTISNFTNTGLKLGRYQTTTYVNIMIDELRFATSTHSLEWVQTEYANQGDSASFYSTSSEEYLDVVSSYTLNEATSDADGDVTIQYANLVAPTSNFKIGGSALNTLGSYNPRTGTTTFDSTDTGETVIFGDGAFYNLAFNGVGGGWTIATTTVTNNVSLVTGASFTLATNTTMTVGGRFNNTFNSANTDWTNSTLVLTGGDYTVTGKSASGDAYARIVVSGDSDLIMWNSSVSTSSIRDTSSLYMPDYGGSDGSLRIYGSYTRTSGTEHWSYATDFDGTALGGSPRPVSVEIDRGADVLFATGTTLAIVGTASATTSIDAVSGIYAFRLEAATLNAQYFSMSGAGPKGLRLLNGSTVSSLTHGEFAVAGGRSGITVDADTINAQPSSEFTNMYFATTSASGIYEPAWAGQVILTVPSGTASEDLTNYPLYVDLSTLGDDFWSGVQSDGRDVRVTTNNGTELPIDLVEINTSAKTGELHFLASTIYSSQDTVFYVHFDNPSATAYAPTEEFGRNAVWAGYEAVYHFNENPTVMITDMTGNDRNLFPTSGTPATTTGLIGTALDTTAANNVRLESPGWTWQAGDDLVSSGLYHMGTFDTSALWQFGVGNGTDNGTYLSFMPWYDNATRGYFRFGMTNNTDYNFARTAAAWHHFTTIGRATVGENSEVYEDNVLRDSVTQVGTAANPTNTGLRIGAYQTTTYGDMEIDELRFATTTRSTGWIDAEYKNLVTPTSFYATSSEQTVAYNITAVGVPSTYWLFSNGNGDLYGEDYDNDDGDPGSIQWDDSNYTITISGVVYGDDGVTPETYPVCNGSTEVVTVVLDGVDTYTAACDPLDGTYEVTGISYVGEPKIVTYLDSNAATPQTNVMLYDEVTGSGTVSGTTMTVTRPNVVDNSVLVLIAGKDDDPTITAPAGWTSINTLGNTTGDQIDTGAWYRVVANAGTEAASYNFTADAGEGFSYWMGTLINVNTASPLDVASTWTKLQNQYAPAAPSITTVTNGAFVISASFTWSDTEVVPPVYGWDDRAKNLLTPESGNLTVSSKSMLVAGPTGVATTTGVIATRDPHVGQFAFRPAASPTGSSSITAAVVTKTPLGNNGSPYDTIELRDQTNGYGTVAAAASFNASRPAVQNGDVLVAIIGKEDDFNITPPSGWVLGAERIEATGNDMYTSTWYHVVTNASGEPATYAFTSNDDSVEEYSYWIGSFSGVDTTTVFDVTPAWSNLQNDSAPAAPSITTVTPGAYVLASWYVIDDPDMNMPGSPWTTLAQDVVTNSRLLAVAGRALSTIGATGNAAITGGSVDDVNVGQFALRPAAVSVQNEIADMDLYQDRVIVRHEDIDALTVADMIAFDGDDDSDIPFTASVGSPDLLTVSTGSGLVVWDGRTFDTGGEVDLAGVGATSVDGSLLVKSSATFKAHTTNYVTIGGSLHLGSGAAFNGASSTVDFTATNAGQTITAVGSSTITFYHPTFTGSGSWTIQTPVVAQSGISVSAGTVNGISDVTVSSGSFSGNGTVNFTAGTAYVKKTNTLGGTTPWSFYNLTLGGTGAGTTKPGSNATTTVRNKLTIAAAHFLNAYGSVWDIQGSGAAFVESGTFLEGTSTIRYSGATPNVLRTPYYNLVIDTQSGGSVAAVAPVTGLQVLNDLTVGRYGTSTLNVNTNDPLLAVGRNVYIGTKGTIEGSNSALFDVLGNWDNDGVYNANGGTVEFIKTGGSATVAAGNSSFGKVVVSGTASYTLSENATSTSDFTLNTGSFTLTSGRTLAVGGQFQNLMNDAATTWSGTTLSLYSGTAFQINSKTTSDTYESIVIGNGTHPRLWNSTTTAVTTNGVSSLYSMDHKNVTGDLYIFGDYVNDGYNDYWSYADDFDGSVLGVPRQAKVYVEAGGSVQYPSGSLYVIGDSSASTTVAAQSAGTYLFLVGGDTEVEMSHYVVRDTTSAGLTFTGSPSIIDLSNGDLEVAIAGGSTMTVGGSVISANPALNFTNISMATTTAINAYNVTATGTSASAWRFVNVGGNLGGEAKDVDPAGDPGYLTWEDSAAIINISGTVYSDEGSTPMGATVCDGTTKNIWLSVHGLTFASTSCAVGTGVYSFTGIGYGVGNTLTVYINDETEKAVTVTQDPVSSITGLDLYQDRVIIKHESAAAMTIADMSTWDSDDDADILFDAETAGSDTLVFPANTKLIVWDNKKFTPAGNVTISGGGAGGAHDGTLELRSGATFTVANGQSHSIGGSLLSGAGAVFTPAQSTTTFTTTGAARTIDTNGTGFYNLKLTGSGSWTVADTNLTVVGDYTQSAGSITLPSATTTIGSQFNVTGGSFNANNGLLYFTATDAANTVRFNGSGVANIRFNGTGGSWTMSDVNATSTGYFTVSAGAVTLPSGKLTIGDNFVVKGSVAHNNGSVRLADTGGSSLLTLSGSTLNNLTIAAGAGGYTLTNATAAILGDLIVESGSFTSGTSTVSIGGSFDATGGTFVHNSGTLLFNSADTGEFIDLGTSPLYNVSFGSASGGWTILGNATTTHNFFITSANSFTVSSGTRLYVGGVFSNTVGGTATNWNGSRLVLSSGTEYEASGKTVATERYNVLEIGAHTDVSMWNSSATSTVVAASGSLYSQDHSATNGSLYIYGDYHIATTTEYWSHATDFDGTALGGSPRAVNVAIASGATVSVDGGVLHMLGAANSTTTVTNQGTGTYTFIVDDGTFDADYYRFRNLSASGLQFTGDATITSLDNGDFEQAANSTTLISLASTTLNANASHIITNTRFANGGYTSGVNVSLDATTTNSWRFTGAIGNLWGEAFDVDGTDDCSSIRWDDSQCLLTEQTNYRWRNDDGGEGAPAGTWYDSNWTARKRVRIVNDDPTTYTDVAVKVPIDFDADMQSNFNDIRFTDAGGTTTLSYWRERYTTGTEADMWVRIPTLTADAVTEIYVYYGNGAATSASDPGNVFNVYDDFEDGNITEYSGDTTKFALSGGYAYGGGFGLYASPDQNAKTNDGIARFDQTVSQGEIIRFMQYVDTSAGSGDEVCTMFGVQSPVTVNHNYGVCIEQFGTDRVSLVKNVENTDSTGTLLATSTISLSTGWYEVMIDWQTNDDIDVSVFNTSGTLLATVSATDSTYTSGGMGFTYWFQHGSWDSYVSWPRTATLPTVHVGAEQSPDGASWAAPQDTATGGFVFGETARLRIGIENTGLPIENQQFRLEFAPKLTAPSCEAVSGGSFVAVPVAASCGTSAVCMTTSASTTNGDPTTDHLLTDAGPFVPGEIVANTSNQTGLLDIDQNRYTELEYALALTVNATNDAYCFRVTDAGSPLDSYAVLPELTLAFDPQLDTISLNGGLDIVLTPGATTTVIASTTVTDYNGYTDLLQATTTFYKSDVTAACTPDNNSCYIATSSCSFTSCSGASCTLTCTADFQFHADPTDQDGGQFWYAFMEVSDQGGATDFGTSIGVDLLTIRALEVQNAINYGTVDINQDTGSFNPTVNILNYGNEAIDVQIAGTDMTDGVASVIPAAQQKFATSTFDYSTCTECQYLSVVGAAVEVDLTKPTTANPPVADSVYWGVAVPFGTASNPHSGINTFTAISD